MFYGRSDIVRTLRLREVGQVVKMEMEETPFDS